MFCQWQDPVSVTVQQTNCKSFFKCQRAKSGTHTQLQNSVSYRVSPSQKEKGRERGTHRQKERHGRHRVPPEQRQPCHARQTVLNCGFCKPKCTQTEGPLLTIARVPRLHLVSPIGSPKQSQIIKDVGRREATS